MYNTLLLNDDFRQKLPTGHTGRHFMVEKQHNFISLGKQIYQVRFTPAPVPFQPSTIVLHITYGELVISKCNEQWFLFDIWYARRRLIIMRAFDIYYVNVITMHLLKSIRPLTPHNKTVSFTQIITQYIRFTQSQPLKFQKCHLPSNLPLLHVRVLIIVADEYYLAMSIEICCTSIISIILYWLFQPPVTFCIWQVSNYQTKIATYWIVSIDWPRKSQQL